MNSVFALSLMLVGPLVLPAAASAQPASPDDRELAAYRLTLANVRKLAAVMRASADETVTPDPRAVEIMTLSKEIGALNAKKTRTPAEEARLTAANARVTIVENEMRKAARQQPAGNTIDGMVTQFSRQPGLAKILAREKFSARECATAYLALLHTAAVYGASGGAVNLDTLPPSVSRQNIAFMKANEKEIEEVLKGLDGFSGK